MIKLFKHSMQYTPFILCQILFSKINCCSSRAFRSSVLIRSLPISDPQGTPTVLQRVLLSFGWRRVLQLSRALLCRCATLEARNGRIRRPSIIFKKPVNPSPPLVTGRVQSFPPTLPTISLDHLGGRFEQKASFPLSPESVDISRCLSVVEHGDRVRL